MTADSGSLNSVFAMMAVSDADIRMPFGYLFSVILERSLHNSASCKGAWAEIAVGLRPRVLIVGGKAVDGDCLTLIRRARGLPNPPLILALDMEGSGQFGAAAFKAGADDVVRPPFALNEFAYRLRARLAPEFDLNDRLDEKVDWDAEASLSNQARLTTAEAQVVRLLISRDGEIVTRDDLSNAIDRKPWEYGDRKFDVHVVKIRKKFQAAFGGRVEVKTIRSAGYQLTLNDDGLAKSKH